MKTQLILTTAFLALATPALAEGDAAKGEKVYKKCKACHAITGANGEKLVKGGQTGPDLYGVIGRTAGSVEGFKYSDILAAAGEGGLVWDQENLAAYTMDPSGYLQEQTGDSGKSKMTLKLKKGNEDVIAYIASLSAE